MEKCIKCGKETEIGLFCTSCYVPEVKMPKSIDIKQCKNCGKYFINNKWQQLTINGLESLIAKKIKGNFKEAYVDINNKEAIIVIEGEKGDFEYTMPININFNYVTCHECLKKKGSYYEGILQIRGEKEKQEQFANMIIKMLKRHTFISKIEEIKEGINIYVGSSKALLNLITNIGIKNYKLSRKLHTAKQGKRVYRLTIAVRLE